MKNQTNQKLNVSLILFMKRQYVYFSVIFIYIGSISGIILWIDQKKMHVCPYVHVATSCDPFWLSFSQMGM